MKIKYATGLKTKEKIMKTSAMLFAKEGYDKVSLRTVARLVEIKESSIYNHFSSKKDLLMSLMKDFVEKYHQVRLEQKALDEQIELQPPNVVFHNYVIQFGLKLDDYLNHCMRVMTMEINKNKEIADMYQTVIVNEPTTYFKDMLNKMSAVGKLSCTNTGAVAKHLNHCLISHSILYSIVNEEERMSVAKDMLEAIDLMIVPYM